MIKKLFSIIAAMYLCTSVLIGGGINAYAAKNYAKGFNGDTSKCGVIDDKNLFSEDKIEQLNKKIQNLSEELELYIVIYLSNTSRSISQTEYFADSKYFELFGEYSDGIIYYMDLSENPIEANDTIATQGKARLLYDDVIDPMFDVIFKYLPSTGETIYETEIELGIEKICEQIEEYGKNKPSVFDYAYSEKHGYYISYKNGKTIVSSSKPPALQLKSLIISLIAGTIIALITYLIVKSHYKFKSSCNPSIYASRDETVYKNKQDIFIRQYTTKTKIESSSGGRSGGGGGGRSSGGGSRSR